MPTLAWDDGDRGLAELSAGHVEAAVHDLRRSAGQAGAGALCRRLECGESAVPHDRGIRRFAIAIVRSFGRQRPRDDIRAAVEFFTNACDQEPGCAMLRVHLANALLFEGRFARESGDDIAAVFDRTRELLARACALDPRLAAAHHNAGIVSFYRAMEAARRKETNQAEAEFKRAMAEIDEAIRIEPDHAYARKDAGVCRVALGRMYVTSGEPATELTAEAIVHLTRAIELKPDLQGAYFERGAAYFARKDFESAMQDWKRCVALGGPSPL